jgi:protein MpaA
MEIEDAPYREIEARWKAQRAARGMRVREVACVGAPRTLLCVEYGDVGKPVILLAAGVHGDEPAGPYALLALVEGDGLDPRFAYRIWPCTNPSGFDAGTRESIDGLDINRTFGRGGSSPEARAVVMANRDYKFALAIDLHEDDEAGGFYCYEYGEPGIGAHVLAAMRAASSACDARGLVRPDPAIEAEEIGGLSLSLLLTRNAAARTLTFETASSTGELPMRVATHVAAVTAAISQTA